MRTRDIVTGAALLATVALINTSCRDTAGPASEPSLEPMPPSQLAQSYSSGPPDNRWTGPLPTGCPDVYIPVRDAQGNQYDNSCLAAMAGVRATWDVCVNCYDLYGVNSNDNGLSIIDPASGVTTFIGPLHPDPDLFVTPGAMAVRPSDGTIFVWNNTDQDPITGEVIGTGVLLTVDPASGRARKVKGSTPGQGTLSALAFSPDGRLFGLDQQLYEIDPSTGVLTRIGSLGLRIGAADFGANGTLYGVELALGLEQLVTIDINTAAVTVIGNLTPDVYPIMGSIVFDPNGRLIGSTAGPENPILFDINTATAAVTNVRAISGGFPPQGMGFVQKF